MSAAAPTFILDPRLEASSAPLARLTLCEARLQLDARWPWIVLVPRRAGLREIEELDPATQAFLMSEAVCAGHAVRAVGEAVGRPVEKLNMGALGNLVAQLHMHVLGRRSDDPAWPGPVWAFGEPEPYSPDRLLQAMDAARAALRRPTRA